MNPVPVKHRCSGQGQPLFASIGVQQVGLRLRCHDAKTNPLNVAAQRLTALEIKASFAEDLLDKLDQIVIRQQTQINALISEVLHLRQQASDPQAQGLRNVRDELPPHY